MFTLAQLPAHTITAIAAIIGAAAGIALAILAGKVFGVLKQSSLNKRIALQTEQAKRDAEEIIKAARIEATAETLKKKNLNHSLNHTHGKRLLHYSTHFHDR
jgi:uncharacterized membrane protein YraQ (UPF0718 family)